MTEKSLVVVCGMHRSGTSAVSGALANTGVNFGEQLTAAAADNEKGFFEDKAVVALNERILANALQTWDSCRMIPPKLCDPSVLQAEFHDAVKIVSRLTGDAPCSGIKDPRVSLLIPFWRAVFAELGLQTHWLLAVRDPHDIAQSLFRRNRIGTAKAHALWLKYSLGALSSLEGQEVSWQVIDYGTLLKEPGAVFASIALQLGLDDGGQKHFTAFLDGGLNHGHGEVQSTGQDDPFTALAKECYAGLQDKQVTEKRLGRWRDQWLALDYLAQTVDLNYQTFASLSDNEKQWVTSLEQRNIALERDLATFSSLERFQADAHGETIEALKVQVNHADELGRQLADKQKHCDELTAYIQKLHEDMQLIQRQSTTLALDVAKSGEALREAEQSKIEAGHHHQQELSHSLAQNRSLFAELQVAEIERRHALELAKAKQQEAWENHQALHEIVNSTSWKVSSPLRLLKRALIGAFRLVR